MSRTYTATVPVELSIDGESFELTAEIRFSYSPGEDASGSMYSRISPPDPECFEDRELVSLKSDGAQLIIPDKLRAKIEAAVSEDTLREAIPDGPDPDDARDRAIDDELCDRANGFVSRYLGDD